MKMNVIRDIFFVFLIIYFSRVDFVSLAQEKPKEFSQQSNTAASIRRRSRQKIKNRKKREKAEKIAQFQYEACKTENISSSDLSNSDQSHENTEAKSCIDCAVSKDVDFEKIKETTYEIQVRDFKSKLQKRVVDQIANKISQTLNLRCCITKNKEHCIQTEINQQNENVLCEKRIKGMKTVIKRLWPEMRIQLSLTSPKLREDRIISEKSTWLDSSPSHSISDFSDLPQLTKEEQARAETLYVKTLAEIPLEQLSSSEFKQRLYDGRALHTHIAGKKHLTKNDQAQLKLAVKDMRTSAKASYSQIVGAMPILGYLKTGNPSNEELDQALERIEIILKEDLEKMKNSEALSMTSLLLYEPLVEELLSEHNEYCSIALQERIQIKKKEEIGDSINFTIGIVAGGICMYATAGICFLVGSTMGLTMGYTNYQLANQGVRTSLGHILTGQQFETIENMERKEQEVFFNALFLYLGTWGMIAGPIKSVSKISTKAVRKSHMRDLKAQMSSLERNRIEIDKSKVTVKSLDAGVHENYIILDSHGKKIGIFKPQKKDEFAISSQEVAAYRFCVVIGCRVVPKTKFARLEEKKGSLQEFVSGETRQQLNSKTDFIKSLKDPHAPLRKDFDEMVVLDLAGGNADRNSENYLIDMVNERLYAIDNSGAYAMKKGKPIVAHWVLDAQESQIWQNPVSEYLREIVMRINFSDINDLYPLIPGNMNRSRKQVHERIKQLKSILHKKPEITLEELVDEMGGFRINPYRRH